MPEEAFEVAYIHPTEEDPRKKVRRVERRADIIGGDDFKGDYGHVLDEMERAEEAGYNVYVSVLPVSHQGHVYDRVWVDQDDPTAPYPFAADERWEGGQWPEPTTLVKTSDAEGGFRWQAIWLLQPGTALSPDEGKAFVKKLAKKAGADESVHDARRVLRVPGILNAKRGSMARLISTSEGHVSTEAFDLPEESYVEGLLNMEVNNPQHILGEWLDGAKEGDRNRKAYVTARFLRSCGVSIEDAGPILKLGAMRCDPELPDHELQHALNSAYHRS